MARTNALGVWLAESKGKAQLRRSPGIDKHKENITTEILFWKLRGILWVSTLVSAIFFNFTAAFGLFTITSILVPPAFPLIVIISLMWTMWDPTYSSIQRARRQGRDVRVGGRETYIKLQFVAWCLRLLTSILMSLAWFNSTWDWLHLYMPPDNRNFAYFTTSLFVEVTLLAASSWTVRIQQPPVIHLLNTDSLKRSPKIPRNASSAAHNSDEPSLFSGLSLASKPILASTRPVFGYPSLPSHPVYEDPKDDDLMDWSPSEAYDQQRTSYEVQDDSWMRPQRFFVPEKPTGLEGLFERTLLVRDEPASGRQSKVNLIRGLYDWWWIYFLLTGLAGGISYKFLKY